MGERCGRDEREKICGEEDLPGGGGGGRRGMGKGNGAAPRGDDRRGRTYAGTLAIFSSMRTSSGTSCMHSAHRVFRVLHRTRVHRGAARRGGHGENTRQ